MKKHSEVSTFHKGVTFILCFWILSGFILLVVSACKAAEPLVLEQPLPLSEQHQGAYLRMGAIGCPSPELLRSQAAIEKQYGGGVTRYGCLRNDRTRRVDLIRDDRHMALVQYDAYTLYFPSNELRWSDPNGIERK